MPRNFRNLGPQSGVSSQDPLKALKMCRDVLDVCHCGPGDPALQGDDDGRAARPLRGKETKEEVDEKD